LIHDKAPFLFGSIPHPLINAFKPFRNTGWSLFCYACKLDNVFTARPAICGTRGAEFAEEGYFFFSAERAEKKKSTP